MKVRREVSLSIVMMDLETLPRLLLLSHQRLLVKIVADMPSMPSMTAPAPQKVQQPGKKVSV